MTSRFLMLILLLTVYCVNANRALIRHPPRAKRAAEKFATNDASASRQSSDIQIVTSSQNQVILCSQNQKRRDSAIYVIKLPPQPYSYVPGLGYISRPALFSDLREQPFIRPAIDFVSNGKPVSVHSWPQMIGNDATLTESTGAGKKDSPVIRLKKGPYTWNGKVQKIHVLDSGGKPPPEVNRV
ncbi:hypothetical protein QAD02_008998 [Eretmocerus hayati]|uniref:Uncharacterized protein n=1 Tax=Eretmocerus hayati TaxID=131215 RepID=A0ACC2N8W2_9HYME|nr:hypothetical protein QAD02_008998 [Eretmocerus hayati]